MKTRAFAIGVLISTTAVLAGCGGGSPSSDAAAVQAALPHLSGFHPPAAFHLPPIKPFHPPEVHPPPRLHPTPGLRPPPVLIRSIDERLSTIAEESETAR